jgi:hypothetical protein
MLLWRMTSKYFTLMFISSGLFATAIAAADGASAGEGPPYPLRSIYAVNEAPKDRGSISVYDIDAGHRLIKTIPTVPKVGDVRGVAASGVTGKLYVAYRDVSGAGMVYCLDVYNDTIV